MGSFYRAHRHRKEILATRRSTGSSDVLSISFSKQCCSSSMHQSTAINSFHSAVSRMFQYYNLKLQFLFIVFVVFPILCNGQSTCIPQCVCMWKGGKQTVECINSRLNHIPVALSHLTQVLDMTGNKIQSIEDRQFVKVKLTNLQKLFLRKCQLRRIEPEAFFKLRNLVLLDLSDNMLTAVPVAALRHPTSLRRLILNSNPISRIEAGSFAHLNDLTILEVRNSQLETISDRALRGLERLEFLKLDGNRIQTIRGDVFESMLSIRGIDLYENPWNCDCHLKTLMKMIQEMMIHLNPAPICMGPPRLYKKIWNRIPLDEFACEPKIMDSSATYQQSIVEGSNITLVCQVSGDPDPNVTWIHRGKAVTNRTEIGSSGAFYSVYNSGYLEKISNLFIPYLRLQDSGKYACVAENVAGKTFRNFTLLTLSHSVVEVKTFFGQDNTKSGKDKSSTKFTNLGEGDSINSTNGKLDNEAPPKGIIIAIGLGIGLLVILIAILLITCIRKQRRARNQDKNNRQTQNPMYKHSNSSNHLPSVTTTEASMVCEDHDITLLDVIKTKPLPRLGPYECIPTNDIDSFDMLPNKAHVGASPPAYIVQPGAMQQSQNVDIWREYPVSSEPTPLGLGISYHRSDAPHHSNEVEQQPGGLDPLQMKLHSELTDTLRRKGDKQKIIPVSIPFPPNMDQRERGDGSSEQSNTTTEYPESFRHPTDRCMRESEKRRHRQSWESMVNRNSDCIVEDDGRKCDTWVDKPHVEHKTGDLSRTANLITSPSSMPMQSRSISGPQPRAPKQPDCVQPLIAIPTEQRIIKKDTEV